MLDLSKYSVLCSVCSGIGLSALFITHSSFPQFPQCEGVGRVNLPIIIHILLLRALLCSYTGFLVTCNNSPGDLEPSEFIAQVYKVQTVHLRHHKLSSVSLSLIQPSPLPQKTLERIPLLPSWWDPPPVTYTAPKVMHPAKAPQATNSPGTRWCSPTQGSSAHPDSYHGTHAAMYPPTLSPS